MAAKAIDRDKVLPVIYAAVASGVALDTVLSDPEVEGLPSTSTFWRWHMEDETIRDNLARARENGVEARLEECIPIADTAVDRDSSAAAKVRVDTRFKLAQMLAPRKYKPGVDVTSNGKTIDVASAIHVGNARVNDGS